MNYQYFKQIIESVERVEEELYDSLVKKYGFKIITSYFERYINDIKSDETEDKFKRVEIYLEKNINKEESDNKVEDLII